MQTWQRNLYTLWVAELVAIAGFTVALIVMAALSNRQAEQTKLPQTWPCCPKRAKCGIIHLDSN